MAAALVMSAPSLSQRKVFVGGLSWETDEQSLRDYFRRFGAVSDCVIMRDRVTGHPRGFGFVTYDDEEVAERVAAEFHELDGRQVEAKIAVPRSECTPSARNNNNNNNNNNINNNNMNNMNNINANNNASCNLNQGVINGNSIMSSTNTCVNNNPNNFIGINNSSSNNISNNNLAINLNAIGMGGVAWRATKKVFIGGLPATCREAELHAHFLRFGNVAECQVMYDHQTGNSRGFGFVTFVSESTVDTVVDLESHEIMGKQVEVKRAEPKQALEARRGREAAVAAAAALSNSFVTSNHVLASPALAPPPPLMSPAKLVGGPSSSLTSAAAVAIASSNSQPRLSSAPSFQFPPTGLNLDGMMNNPRSASAAAAAAAAAVNSSMAAAAAAHSSTGNFVGSWTSLFGSASNAGTDWSNGCTTPDLSSSTCTIRPSLNHSLHQHHSQQRQQQVASQQQQQGSNRGGGIGAASSTAGVGGVTGWSGGSLVNNRTGGATGFFSPAQTYGPELAQCAYNALYGSYTPTDIFSSEIPGGMSSSRLDRRFHPYSSRERVERSYR